MEKKELKELYEKIVDICKDNIDVSDVNRIIDIAKINLLKIEWEENYGIEVNLSMYNYREGWIDLNFYTMIVYYEEGGNRNISSSDDGRQPSNEWLLVLILNGVIDMDSPYDLLEDFFNKVKSYKPDYADTMNKRLYWKLPNAKAIYTDLPNIISEYRKKSKAVLNQEEIIRLEKKINELKKEQIKLKGKYE